MIIILKIFLILQIIIIGSVEYIVFKQFRDSKLTEEYDNSNLFGKLITNAMFYIVTSCILSTMIFLFYILFSNISIL